MIRLPGSGLSLELVEWRDVERTPARLRLQDPGATTLILTVRDIQKIRAWLLQNGATIITPSATPVDIEVAEMTSRTLFATDPDGFFLEIAQPEPDSTAPADPSANNVTGATFALTIGNTETTMRFYREAFGFQPEVGNSFVFDPIWATAAGVKGAQHRTSSALIPGSSIRMQFIELKGIDRKTLRSRIQDPGTSMLQLSVRDIRSTVASLKTAGGLVITTGGGSTLRHDNPISLVRDPRNNFFVEPMEPAGTAAASR